jgi:hypothetical protein
MISTISAISVAIAFVSIVLGVVFFKKKTLFVVFISIGILLIAFPFVRHFVLTRDAYDWTIVVRRVPPSGRDPRVLFISDIEWITDYEKLKRQRGDVRSYVMAEDTTEKVWNAKGYIPLYIVVDILYGSSTMKIGRNFDGLEAGSYTFTFTFDEEKYRGTWDIEKNVSD